MNLFSCEQTKVHHEIYFTKITQLSKSFQRSKMDKYGITYMWKLKHKNKNDTNEIIYKTEIEPRM